MFDFALAIIWMVLFVLAFTAQAVNHGKPKKGNYNIFGIIIFWAMPVYLVVKAYFINYGV